MMMSQSDSKPAKRQDGVLLAKPRTVVNLEPGKDRHDGPGGLRLIAGSPYPPLNNILVNQALAALWLAPGDPEEQDRRYNAALAAMMEFKPADGIEGMMAVQAVGLHSAAMECLRRAMILEQPGEMADKLRRQAANLSRAFLEVLAALDRKRGKSVRQVVRVERVMVAPGGQAIVGNIEAGAANREQHRERVGHDGEVEEEPHTPPTGLAHDAAPGTILPSLRSADTSPDALPVACDA
jgi:hypothetical protein